MLFYYLICHTYLYEKDKGTIPESTYVARQSELQRITPYGLVLGFVNAGTWPGGLYSWGGSRAKLEASQQTDTYDRGVFYIHGGWGFTVPVSPPEIQRPLAGRLIFMFTDKMLCLFATHTQTVIYNGHLHSTSG